MFAVRDNRTGKFLRHFSGSLNDFKRNCRYKAVQNHIHNDFIKESAHDDMFSLDTPNGAKLFASKQGVSAAFYSYRYRDRIGTKMMSLQEAMPYLEIVEVAIGVA